jgi:hypothetical protein
MNEVAYTAVYSDGTVLPVEWNDVDGQTYICKDEALLPVPYYLANGAGFVEYRCTSIGLTPGAHWEEDSKMQRRLTCPKPTAPPVLEAANNDESFVPKFHCPRLPGEDSFRYLQRQNAEKVEWERTQRAIARRSHMSETEASAFSSNKVEEARTARALGLASRKPRGGGGGFETTRES